MQLRRIRLPRDALQQMPEAERAFLLLAGHMQNELNSLHKVFAWCLHAGGQTSPVESLANGVQAQLFARLLAGKLLEAWNALGTAFFGAKISRRIEPSLHPAAQEALTKLKTYFGKPNVIFKVRNSFAFHYAADEFERHWLRVADDPRFEIILGGTVGNNLDLASELVVTAAVLNSAAQQDESHALRAFLNEVQSTATYFTAFLEGAILVLLESALPSPLANHGSTESIEPRFRFDDVAIPHFYDHGLEDA
jgi:hypothetical protein